MISGPAAATSLGRLGGQEGLELGLGQVGVSPPVLGEDVLPLLTLVHLAHRVAQSLLVGVSDAGRCDDAAPVGELQVDAGLLECRGVDGIDPLGSTDRQDSNLAGFHLVEELAEAGGTESDLAAEHGREQIATAVVGHEVHVLGVDPDGLRELHGEQVVGTTR